MKIWNLLILSAIINAYSFDLAAMTNLVSNSGFENDLTSWNTTGYSWPVRTVAGAPTSLRLGIGPGKVTQDIMKRLTIGKNYNFSVIARLSTMNRSTSVGIRFLNLKGATIKETNLVVNSISDKTYSFKFQVPKNSVVAEVYSNKNATSSTFSYIDNFSVIDQSPSPSPTLTSEYSPMGIGGGGAMSGISISPYADLWFVGSDMGTLFRSTDLGKNWIPVSHTQAVFDSNLSKAVAPGFSADGLTVFHAEAGINPKRSSDSGVTFSKITIPLLAGELIKYWYSDTTNANVIYAGTNHGLLKTIDKGNSWIRLTTTNEESIGLFIDQTTATKRIYHASKNKVSYSDNGGTTFSLYYNSTSAIRQFAAGADSSGLTIALSDSDGTYACYWAYAYANEVGQVPVDNTIKTCGYVWINKNNTSFIKSTQIVGDHIKMAENDSSTMYITGGKDWIRNYGTKVQVSHDKGSSWVLKLNQLDYDNNYTSWPSSKIEYSAVALDVGWWDSGYESFSINQKNSSIVAGSGLFFLHSSFNSGDNWLAPFTKYAGTGIPAKGQNWLSTGLEVTTVYKTKFHPKNPSLLYAAMADISGVISEDHGKSFRITKPGYNSIYDFAFDPDDDQIVYAALGATHDFPYEWHANVLTSNGGIYKSYNRGRAWERLTPENATFNRQFLSVAYDSRNDIIYGGTQEIGIVSSTDKGVTWVSNNLGFPAGNKIIPQIEIDPNNGNAYALLTGDAPNFSNQTKTGVYFLDVQNNSKTWVLLRGTVNYPPNADPGYLVWYYPTSFAIDFNSLEGANTIYLSDYENKGNWLMTGVWKTTNKGTNWNRVVQFTHPTEIKIDPKNTNHIFASGLYGGDGGWGNGGQLYSNDAGVTWSKNNSLLLQNNARGVTLDPSDSNKILYSYFGSGMLYGPNPNK